MYKIYALVVYERIFYVGRTKSLVGRLMTHLNAVNHSSLSKYPLYKFIKKQKRNNIQIIEIDCSDDYNESFLLEEYWIHQIRAWGFSIFNMHKTRNDQATRWMVKRIFTEKELKTISKRYRVGDATKIANLVGKSNEMIRLCLVGKQKVVRVEIYEAIKDFYKINNQ